MLRQRESKSEWRWESSLKKERAGEALSFGERMLVRGLQGVEGQGEPHRWGSHLQGPSTGAERSEVWACPRCKSGPSWGGRPEDWGGGGSCPEAEMCCPLRLNGAEKKGGRAWRPEEAGDRSGREQFSWKGWREGWKMSLCVYLGRHRMPDSRARGRCPCALNRDLGLRWMAEAIKVIGAQEVKG